MPLEFEQLNRTEASAPSVEMRLSDPIEMAAKAEQQAAEYLSVGQASQEVNAAYPEQAPEFILTPEHAHRLTGLGQRLVDGYREIYAPEE